MNRIDTIFKQLRQAGEKALMPYLTAGDPDLQTTAQLLTALENSGAVICELGIPFSDPIADGPVIQASMTHALDQQLDPLQIFEMVRQCRSKLSLGLVAMVSYSIVHRLGVDAYITKAKEVGIDGLIVPDLPLEESSLLCKKAADAGLITSFLIAPSTPDRRAMDIAKISTGFIYLLARSGITGERSELPADLTERVERLRHVTDLPIAVGFGISTPKQVAQVVQVADAAIVGSAIMRRVAESRQTDRTQVVQCVSDFVRDLANGLSI